MSTVTASPADGTAAAPAVSAAPADKPKVTPSIAASIRRRAQGLPELTPEQMAEAKTKAEADKAAADKKSADGTPAAAVTPPVVEKVRKVKAGPALPEPKATPTGDQKSVADQVADALAKDKAAAAATPPVSPEIEREVELAKFAARKNPDKYAGMADRVAGFYASRDTMLAEKARELGGQNSGEFKDYIDSDEFKDWVRTNRPVYQRGDVAKLQEDMIADRVRAETRAEMAPELKALERQTAELRHGPEINALTNQALRIIITDASEDKDPALAGFAADPIRFGEQFPDEARLIASSAADAIDQIKEVYRIDRDLVDFNPRKPTERQAQIREFAVERNARLREKHPTGLEMNDGKILIDADTFEKRALHADPRYRTFTADELAGMIAAEKNAEVLAKLRQRREGVTKSIYAPRGAAAVPAAVVQETVVETEGTPSPDAVTSRPTGGRGAVAPRTEFQKAKDRYLNGK
jgi:hypothetical protein